jgi:molecular chaperone GrpE (heat shock protein)
MASDPVECRKRALRCRELAERAMNSQVKAALTYLAEHWLNVADELERAQSSEGA